MIWLMILVLGMVGLTFGLWKFNLREASETRPEFGVPHCEFTRTEEGFVCSFLRFPEWIDKATAAEGAAGAFAGMLAIVGIVVYCVAYGRTRIEVNREWVVVDKKKMKRGEFGHFCIHHKLNIQKREKTAARLGYSFGRQTFALGGLWEDEGHATEVAAALNAELYRLREASSISPEQLRAAPPAEF